jgi:hypothetical protein
MVSLSGAEDSCEDDISLAALDRLVVEALPWVAEENSALQQLRSSDVPTALQALETSMPELARVRGACKVQTGGPRCACAQLGLLPLCHTAGCTRGVHAEEAVVPGRAAHRFGRRGRGLSDSQSHNKAAGWVGALPAVPDKAPIVLLRYGSKHGLGMQLLLLIALRVVTPLPQPPDLYPRRPRSA